MSPSGLPQNIEQADLVSYGIFGLIDAIDKFDTDRGIKFETYAIARIKGAIIDELRSIDWVPRSVRAKARSVEKAYAKLETDLLRTPTDAEVAAEMGISEDELHHDVQPDLLRRPGRARRDAVGAGGERGESTTLGDTIADRGEGPVAAFEVEEMKQILANAINRLREREKIVLTLYYYEGLTLAEIGEVLGVTESRVCQIHTKAVLQLRSRHDRTGAGSRSTGNAPRHPATSPRSVPPSRWERRMGRIPPSCHGARRCSPASPAPRRRTSAPATAPSPPTADAPPATAATVAVHYRGPGRRARWSIPSGRRPPYAAGNRGIDYAVEAGDGRARRGGRGGGRSPARSGVGGRDRPAPRSAQHDLHVAGRPRREGGDAVAAGQTLGTTSSAFHFGVRAGERYLDPAVLLDDPPPGRVHWCRSPCGDVSSQAGHIGGGRVT